MRGPGLAGLLRGPQKLNCAPAVLSARGLSKGDPLEGHFGVGFMSTNHLGSSFSENSESWGP